MARSYTRNELSTFGEILIEILEYCYRSLQSNESTKINDYCDALLTDTNNSRLNYLIEFLSVKNRADYLIVFYNKNIARELYNLIEILAGQRVEYEIDSELLNDITRLADIFDDPDDIPIKRVVGIVKKLRDDNHLDEHSDNRDYINRRRIDSSNKSINNLVDDNDRLFAFDNDDDGFLLCRLVRDYVRKDDALSAIDEIDKLLNRLNVRHRRFTRRALIKRLLDIKTYVNSTKSFDHSLISFDFYLDAEIDDIRRSIINGTLYYAKRDLSVDSLIIRYEANTIWRHIRSLSLKFVRDVLTIFGRLFDFIIELFARSKCSSCRQKSPSILSVCCAD